MSANNRINLLLCLLLTICGLSLVRAQYDGRRLFIELERARAEERQLNIAWSQLQLDQSTLGNNARIEKVARDSLQMMPLTPERTQYLGMEGK
ncbi:cell division protein FtsL [Massilia sp. W12]|uniref:cell division protein FtsL n=1 Tax=Massilia sp. W12 TaxID=3126507 RepID=UPI0030CA8B03